MAAAGIVIGVTGRYQPFLIGGALITLAGVALFYTMDEATTAARYLGYQALFGIGIGLCVQVPMTAVQAFSAASDLAANTGLLLCESSCVLKTIMHGS